MKIDIAQLSKTMFIASVLTLAGTIAVTIVLVLAVYSLSYDYNLPIIPPIQFEKNNWLKTDNLVIKDSSNNNYAIVGDLLYYKANFTNISKDYLFFMPQVEIHFDDSPPTKITYDPIYLNPNETKSQSFSFSLTHEGTNNFLLLFDVRNQSNGNHTGGIRATDSIPGLTFSNVLQHDANSLNLKNTIITSVIGSVTTIALIVSILTARNQAGTAKKQLKQYELEINNRMRPWVAPISIEARYIEFPNSYRGTVSYDEGIDLIVEKKESDIDAIVTFEMIIKNSGSVPAKNVLYRQLVEAENITQEQLLLSKPIKTISLMPEESDRISITIPITKCDEGCFVGLSVEYVVRNFKEKAGKIWQLTYNDEILKDSWVEQESISNTNNKKMTRTS